MSQPDARSTRRALALVTLLAVAVLLITRAVGPTDLWDQTQPRTIAYTVDMLVEGGSSWLLPLDAAGFPATKPPLVNWVATPFVAALGRASHLGHKMPAVLALLALVIMLARLGDRIAPSAGWMAALMCVSCYPIFKLGYLARPDMLLIALLTGAWWAATRLLLEPTGRRVPWQATFWTLLVLATLTKGPVAVLPLVYVVVAARLLTGRWSAAGAVGPLGAVAAIAVVATYYAALAWIEPEHLRETIWNAEIYSRIISDPEDAGHRLDLVGYLTDLFKMPVYFAVRFLPWSVPAIIGAVLLLRTPAAARDSSHRHALAALIWAGCIIGVFSLAVGKRADYIAPSYPPMALVASWWVMGVLRGVAWRYIPPLAAVTLGVLVVTHLALPAQPRDALNAVRELERTLAADAADATAPQVVRSPRFLEHLPVVAGTGRPSASSLESVAMLLDRGGPFRLIYTPETVDPELLEAIADRRDRGLVREVWSQTLEWEFDGGRRPRTLVCIDVAATEDAHLSGGSPPGPPGAP